MTCHEVRDRLHPYVDDELGVEAALAVEQHLERCPACRSAVDRQRRFRQTVATLHPSAKAPEALRRAIRTPSGVQPGRSRRVAALGALAASVLAIAGTWAMRAYRTETPPAEIGAALRMHDAALRGAARPAFASSDLDAVNGWLARELPFVPALPEAAPETFRLAGASAVRLGGEQAAWVQYLHDDAPVSLFVLPPRFWPAVGREIRHRGIEFRALEVGGRRVIAWNHAPVSYLLVSAADRPGEEACGVCHASRSNPAVAGFADVDGS
jgi:anti-sigma factor RsiW